MALPTLVIGPVRFALVVTVAAFPVIEPEIEFVTVKSVNHPLTILVPVEPIIPLASVANIEAAAPGVEEDVIAWVWAVAVELVDDTVNVPGVAIVVAKELVPDPVTAPVRVMVWSPVFVPDDGTFDSRTKSKQIQLPEPRDLKKPTSLATVTIFAAPGKIKLVALWVKVKAPVNLTVLSTPAAAVPKAVIVVVPVTSTKLPVAVAKFVVLAEAISAPLIHKASKAA